MRFAVDPACFVCGPENPAGLQVVFETAEGRAQARFTPQAQHHGYADVTHGGILAALLDEAMVYAAASLGGWVATAEMTVRYLRPVTTGTPLLITGEVLRAGSRLVECAAEIRSEAGDLLAR